MIRPTIIAICLTLPFAAQAASLKEYNLQQTLQAVAKKSSIGTPRKINNDLTDNGYTTQDNILTNHIGVSAKQAKQMRDHPKAMRQQLTQSVCKSAGYRNLLQQGAVLSYKFTEKGSRQPISEELFLASDCGI